MYISAPMKRELLLKRRKRLENPARRDKRKGEYWPASCSRLLAKSWLLREGRRTSMNFAQNIRSRAEEVNPYLGVK